MLDSPVFNIDVNQRDRHTDEPPLIEAARSGNLEIVQVRTLVLFPSSAPQRQAKLTTELSLSTVSP
jgi:hypothetical protein